MVIICSAYASLYRTNMDLIHWIHIQLGKLTLTLTAYFLHINSIQFYQGGSNRANEENCLYIDMDVQRA